MKNLPSLKHFPRKLYTAFCILAARIIHGCRALSKKPAPGHRPLTLVLLISRPQDIDLFIDIYQQSLKKTEIEVLFWATKRALGHFPATRKLLDEKGIHTVFTVSHGNLVAAIPRLLKIDALLNTVESTVASHKVPSSITRIANACRVHTYTMQHGFENVGLTYQDLEQGADVHFAARNVLTWGPVKQLPGIVAPDTRRKCLAVGCPKAHLVHLEKPREMFVEKPIIAVFEGLHANRFDRRYLELFFADLQQMADTFPNLRFILKPHPGIIQRRKAHAEFLQAVKNIEVLDPANADINQWSTPTLLAQALAVVTTPSTIALDAALAATPVAVTRYRQKVPYYAYYEPLPIIDGADDWQNFLESALTERAHLQKLSHCFRERVCLPGNAAERILAVVSEQNS